mmetsp:Transcript_43609/g.68276  ORF Transcript_43609/g.68276 Transcript_43609/m.68276 type:complete len:185 (-) Transcript_43609:294-848(-)
MNNTNSPQGLEGFDRRFVGFNGAVGQNQLKWLEGVLAEAEQADEQVVIFSHNPLHPDCTSPICLLWNYDQVLKLIHRYAPNIAGCFSGHAHAGGFCVDEAGIHHRVLEAVVECPPGTDAFGIVEVYRDRLELRGYGGMKDTSFAFRRSSDGGDRGQELAPVSAAGTNWKSPHGHGLPIPGSTVS